MSGAALRVIKPGRAFCQSLGPLYKGVIVLTIYPYNCFVWGLERMVPETQEGHCR